MSYNQAQIKQVEYDISTSGGDCSSGGGEGPDQEILQVGAVITAFLQATSSQLTYHGLAELHRELKEGQLAVFFRNNHYSVLHKHEGLLYNLVTDEGYAHHSTICWELLENIEGDSDFFDHRFR